MSEEEQIRNIVAAAKSAPKKIGVVIDDHKEERFMKKIQAELPKDGFDVECNQMIPKVKVITITRRKAVDPLHN